MKKNKWLLIPIDLGIIMLPWIIGQLYINTLENEVAQAVGMAGGFWLITTTPCIIVIGLLVTVLSSNSVNAFKYSILAFGIPTIISLLYLLSLSPNN